MLEHTAISNDHFPKSFVRGVDFALYRYDAVPHDGSIRELADPIERQYWECDALTRSCSAFEHNEFGPALVDFGERLTADLARRGDGLGIAANQVGVTRRLFVMLHKGAPLVACNPKIKVLNSLTSFETEGCLSMPGVYVPVCRPSNVQMTYQHPATGAEHTVNVHGIDAHVAQHEVDHLEGLMFFSAGNVNAQTRKQVLGEWKRKRKHLPLAMRKGSR